HMAEPLETNNGPEERGHVFIDDNAGTRISHDLTAGAAQEDAADLFQKVPAYVLVGDIAPVEQDTSGPRKQGIVALVLKVDAEMPQAHPIAVERDHARLAMSRNDPVREGRLFGDERVETIDRIHHARGADFNVGVQPWYGKTAGRVIEMKTNELHLRVSC